MSVSIYLCLSFFEILVQLFDLFLQSAHFFLANRKRLLQFLLIFDQTLDLPIFAKQ